MMIVDWIWEQKLLISLVYSQRMFLVLSSSYDKKKPNSTSLSLIHRKSRKHRVSILDNGNFLCISLKHYRHGLMTGRLNIMGARLRTGYRLTW